MPDPNGLPIAGYRGIRNGLEKQVRRLAHDLGLATPPVELPS